MNNSRTSQTLFASCCSWFASLAVLLAMTAGVSAQSYTFTNIADTGGLFSDFEVPSINAGRTVAFFAELSAGGEGIFTGSGGAITTIADTDSGPFAGFGPVPTINASGTVAFHAFPTAGGESLHTGSGGAITLVVDTSGPFSSFGEPSINASGTVAVQGGPDTGGDGTYTFSGGTTTTIAESGGEFFTFVGRPSINAAGTASFVAFTDDGDEEGVFIGNGGPITTIAHTTGPFALLLGSNPSINDSGTVAFLAPTDAGAFGIFTGNGGATTPIVDASGPFFGFGDPALNADGTVAFAATFDNPGVGGGIFIGDDPVADKVIQIGDPLFGSTVTLLFFAKAGLNDDGDVAFGYTLDNGVSGIAVAAVDGGVANEDGPGEQPVVALGVPHPNPASSLTKLHIRVDRSQTVTAELFDVTGRRVRVLHEGVLAADAAFDLEINTRNLPAGVYFVRLIGETETAIQQISVIH